MSFNNVTESRTASSIVKSNIKVSIDDRKSELTWQSKNVKRDGVMGRPDFILLLITNAVMQLSQWIQPHIPSQRFCQVKFG